MKTPTYGPVSRRPRKVFALENRIKISNFMITEPFYSDIPASYEQTLIILDASGPTPQAFFLDTDQPKLMAV